MKLRTSFCNPTALKKDITRFAPSWALYSVMLFLTLSTIATGTSDYARTSDLMSSMTFMIIVNMIYGFINGQALFTDLFNTRHCNALHAMPLRRECWYMTHVIAGLLFSLVPNAVFTLAMVPLLGTGAVMAAYWMLAVTLQYLFFFGLAVCSALCVGNRFAMALVYLITNFLSMIIYVLYINLYEPLLEGVNVPAQAAYRFCPVVQMMSEESDFMNLVATPLETVDGAYYVYERRILGISMGEGWGYLAICAAIGVALLGVALALYRRRKLESAGDFMAVKALEPVFLVLYTLAVSVLLYVFGSLFEELEYLFLGAGFLVGFFTGRMLLMRTTRVFQPKAFLWFAIFVAVFVGSLGLTAADPLGVAQYVPAANEVSKVRISSSYSPEYGGEPFLTEEDDIALARKLHQMILDGQDEIEHADDEVSSRVNLSFLYHLDNGSVLIRRYDVDRDSPVGVLFGQFNSRVEMVLGTDDLDEFMKGLYNVYVSLQNTNVSGSLTIEGNRELIRGLAEAIMADCEAGNMNRVYTYQSEDSDYVGWLEFAYRDTDGSYRNISLEIFSKAEKTTAYLIEHRRELLNDQGY